MSLMEKLYTHTHMPHVYHCGLGVSSRCLCWKYICMYVCMSRDVDQ